MAIFCRGLRGATTADANTPEAILTATHELLAVLIDANELHSDDIGSVLFTTTPDLDAEFPARATRQLGWHNVALMCSNEIDVRHAPRRCIRVLIHWNTAKLQSELQHVYLKGARSLRPERSWSPLTQAA